MVAPVRKFILHTPELPLESHFHGRTRSEFPSGSDRTNTLATPELGAIHEAPAQAADFASDIEAVRQYLESIFKTFEQQYPDCVELNLQDALKQGDLRIKLAEELLVGLTEYHEQALENQFPVALRAGKNDSGMTRALKKAARHEVLNTRTQNDLTQTQIENLIPVVCRILIKEKPGQLVAPKDSSDLTVLQQCIKNLERLVLSCENIDELTNMVHHLFQMAQAYAGKSPNSN